MTEETIHSTFTKKDKTLEVSLRPKRLQEFVGQNAISKRLHVLIQAANQRAQPLDHLLLSGPPGLGKTTLAHILAQEMDSKITITSGPAIEKAGDLAGILTSLEEGDILFIDEIHRLSKVVEEYLYPAMENFQLDLVIDTGPAARSVQVKLNPFTLIGATTKAGALSSPLLSRFSHQLRLNLYEPQDLNIIVQNNAKTLKIPLEDSATKHIAKCARGTPRIANNLTRWVRDWSQVNAANLSLEQKQIEQAFEMMGIDQFGLDEMDLQILDIIIEKFNGGPVGLSTLAIALHEEKQTLEEVHEPFLIRLGLIKRTSRGRVATKLGYEHLNKIFGEER